MDGADLAAIMYTIIEFFKKFEIDRRQYILETLKTSAAKQITLTPYKFALKIRSQQPAQSSGYQKSIKAKLAPSINVFTS